METVHQNHPSDPSPPHQPNPETEVNNLFKVNTVTQNCEDLTQVSGNPTQTSQVILKTKNKNKQKNKTHFKIKPPKHKGSPNNRIT